MFHSSELPSLSSVDSDVSAVFTFLSRGMLFVLVMFQRDDMFIGERLHSTRV